MKCKERSGVLFNHDCDQNATQSCAHCNKPICERHMRHFQDKPACVTCVRSGLQDHRSRGEQLSNRYEHDPYFYFYYYGSSWSNDPYDADDYDLFDTAPAGDWNDGDMGGWEGS